MSAHLRVYTGDSILVPPFPLPYFPTWIIFTTEKFGLAKRPAGFAVCGGSLLNGNRYRDCKLHTHTRNKNAGGKKKRKRGKRNDGGKEGRERATGAVGERTQTRHLVDKRRNQRAVQAEFDIFM